jgi:DNA modification methylase
MGLEDNRGAQEGIEWDPGILAELAQQFDVSGLFTGDELAEWAQPSEPEAGAGGDEFDTTPDDGPTRAQLGDLWVIGGVHRLLVGDCTDPANVARLMGGERAALGIHDPPYGIDASSMTMGSGESAKPKELRLSTGQEWDGKRPDVLPLLKASDYVCIWGGNYFADVLPVTNDWLCWWKNNDNLSFSEFELAWTNYDNNARHLTHHWGAERKEHITQKPLSVIEWAIKQCPGKPDLMVDFYLGSGTTLIAAHRTGRRCYGCELAPKYADVILRRAEAEGLSVELVPSS